jgi:protein-tyrosine phosphatase
MSSLPYIAPQPIASSRWLRFVQSRHGTTRGWVRSVLADGEYLLGRLERFTHPRPERVRRLVFVCLGNINRSAFAAAVAAQRGAAVVSIGLSTTTGAPATPMAQQCATDFGLDLSSHRATDLGDYRFEEGDLLLAMETRHARQLEAVGIPPGAIALLGHWSSPHRIHLHDPHTLSEAYFRTCLTLLHAAVRGLIRELDAGASPAVRR